MEKITRYILITASLLVVLPALLINLGVMPYIDDEAIRALVAFEMKQSGNYIVPTIGGDVYLKKPPLYNWIICGSFSATGIYNEFSSRLPTVLFLVLFAIILFLLNKPVLGNGYAFILAFAFITSGRILFYESQKGLIDVLFSLVIYLNFYAIYKAFTAKNRGYYLILSYILCVIAYFLKALPAFVFQVLIIFGAVYVFKNIKPLLSKWNFIGLFLLILFIGYYYLFYFSEAPSSNNPQNLFNVLFVESIKRTGIYLGTSSTILHFITFPFEFLFHFLPWTIIIIVFIRRYYWEMAISNIFIRYLIVIFLINIIVYWTSPEVYARYLLMFVPLFLTLVFYIYKLLPVGERIKKVIDYTFLVLLVITSLLSISVLFHPIVKQVPAGYIKAVLILFSFVIISMIGIRYKSNIFYSVITFLLIARLAFNWFVIPHRINETKNHITKDDAIEISTITYGSPLYLYWPQMMEPDPYYGKRLIDYSSMFYIGTKRNEMLTTKSELIPGAYYIADPVKISSWEYNVQYIKKFTDSQGTKVLYFISDNK